MTKKPIVASITQTCFACPSQWEGRLQDGRHLYIRYRWGVLSMRYGKFFEISKSIGNNMDGLMSEADMKELLSEYLDFSNAKTCYDDDGFQTHSED